MKYLFYDDYSEGAHPEILAALAEHNDEQQAGYGLDRWSLAAGASIQRFFNTDADVHLVSGATQANFIGLLSMLRPHQGVIAPTSGHINTHEAGALEAAGHKILSVPDVRGKLTPATLETALAMHENEHTVMPRVAYITQATEQGTVYTTDEFNDVVECAKGHGLYVFVDGARMSMAFAAPGTPSAGEIALAADMFTVGGTKTGGLFGEAIVIPNPELRGDFRYLIKQRGALLAKGRAIGQQFARFFGDDNLWLELGRQSNTNAARLATGLEALGVRMWNPCVMNQVFPVMPDSMVEKLEQDYGLYRWAREGDECVIRLTCSWATTPEAIDGFLESCTSSLS